MFVELMVAAGSGPDKHWLNKQHKQHERNR